MVIELSLPAETLAAMWRCKQQVMFGLPFFCEGDEENKV